MRRTWLALSVATVALPLGCATSLQQSAPIVPPQIPSARDAGLPDVVTAPAPPANRAGPPTVAPVVYQQSEMPAEGSPPPKFQAPEDPTPPPRTAPDPAVPNSAEASPRELQPGVGEVFVEPPVVPPTPEDLADLQRAPQIDASATPVSLEMLEELACRSNPTLLQAQAEVQGALGTAIQAGLWPNPTAHYLQEQIGVEGTPGEFVGGFVQQEIVTGHKRDLSREKFLARTQAAEWVALQQQYRVLNDVRIHYYRTAGRQELVRIREELLKTSEDALLTVREMYNVGQATRAEVHQANVALQQARLELLMAVNDYRTGWEELTALVGVNMPLSPLADPLEGELAVIDWDQALARLLAQSPQMGEANAKLRGDQVTVKRELVEPVPNVFLRGGAGQNFEADQTVGVFEAFVEVPLYDWNQGTIRQAEADLARQQGEIRRVELFLRRELAVTYRQYLTALQHVQNYEQVILPEAQQAYEVLLDSYEDDRVAWPVVLVAEREWRTLRMQYVQQLMTLRETETLIAGFLLHGGLAPAPTPTPPGHIDATANPR